MYRKRLFYLAAIVALALSACSAPATPPPQQAATTAPAAPTSAPTTAPTTAPTSAPTTAPATAPAVAAATTAPTSAATSAATRAATAAVAAATVPASGTAAAAPGTAAATGGALISVKTDQAPKLDGAGDEAAWSQAQPVTIKVAGGANKSDTTATIKSVYTADSVYFLLTWADPTQSWERAPWVKQQDGTWKVEADPNDKGGDNSLYYEDKLAMIWPINNSIPNFATAGCMTLCHVGENSDVKPYGNKYTAAEGQIGDIWHWKSVRNLNQIDDQYVDNTHYSKDTPEAGRKSDANTGGGYKTNESQDKSKPAFMLPAGQPKDGSPGYILENEKVPFDDAQFKSGDKVPGITKAEFQGDRGDISAGWKYNNGTWTLEFGRKLTTGSKTDVQFDNLSSTYYFGLAIFDNTQVRHAFQNGATGFTFQGAAGAASTPGTTTGAAAGTPAVGGTGTPATSGAATGTPASGSAGATAGGIPMIPHPVAGRDQCLTCHAAGSTIAKPIPPDHTGRTNETCQGCHKPASQ